MRLTAPLVSLVILLAAAHVRADCSVLLCIVNSYRSDSGLPNLGPSTALDAAAQEQANYQTRAGLTHVGSGGSDAGSRIRNHGYGSAVSTGENVAEGVSTEQAVMDMWMSSSGHAANILDSSFTHMGCGLAYSSNGDAYWAQTFASDGKRHNFAACSTGSASTAAGSAPTSKTSSSSTTGSGSSGSSKQVTTAASTQLVIEV